MIMKNSQAVVRKKFFKKIFVGQKNYSQIQKKQWFFIVCR